MKKSSTKKLKKHILENITKNGKQTFLYFPHSYNGEIEITLPNETNFEKSELNKYSKHEFDFNDGKTKYTHNISPENATIYFNKHSQQFFIISIYDEN